MIQSILEMRKALNGEAFFKLFLFGFCIAFFTLTHNLKLDYLTQAALIHPKKEARNFLSSCSNVSLYLLD